MRGGLERWKRGVGSQGVRQALGYALKGSCDSHLREATGVNALAGYSAAASVGVTRFTVEAGIITIDALDETQLRRWVEGRDPDTGELRGRDLSSPDADLILDGTINAPKSYSIAALINEDLARELELLQDRLRDRIITIWQRELNARRGAGGRIRESLHRIEVVELQHRRSRALDPHIHRHLWLNVKVQGDDGQWSNVDSRVAMRLHTVINAEGELAARTDPEWMAALARHGYSLNSEGEIAALAHAVRPLSRRSTQIESNRSMLLVAWRREYPGQEPSPDQVHRIDRLAWARARPNKPGDLDETAWEKLIAGELGAIDSDLLRARREVPFRAVSVEGLDLDLLAAQAIVEADARSACCGGRFSLFDVRAGATRALAGCGVVAPRDHLQRVIDDVIDRALRLATDLLKDEAERPAHVKAYMASTTARLKVELGARFDALSRAGEAIGSDVIVRIAAQVLDEYVVLDERQVQAAAAIAGTDRLVSVTGPAGAGKTTMLRVAKVAIARQGYRMLVVAPTKKAASVAEREIGTSASSLHALLADHGFRWGRDQAGAEAWSRLAVGDVDPATGIEFAGPRRFLLAGGDRVVVDEAGMVDLQTATALATVADETGAGVAMVGDHLQARPVGHSGAMASMTRRATAVVELTAVHRFMDPDYAALTLRMREPASKDVALAVAAELDGRGLIRRVSDHDQAREEMIDAYFRWAANNGRVALVTSSNEEADAINERIQQRRLDRGQLGDTRIVVGQREQRLLEGDIVQTRRNDRRTGVENRAVWVIRNIGPRGVELVSLGDSGDTCTVAHEYTAEHVHLAYASTVRGIQGETTDAAIVGPGVDAAGLYVGMTRGRAHNVAITVARTDAEALDQTADSMMRGIPEVSIEDSIRAARIELGRAARVGDPVRGPVPGLGDRLVRQDISIRAAMAKLLETDARIAAKDSSAHGRKSGAEVDSLTNARAELVAQYEARADEYSELTRQYGGRLHVDGGRSGQSLMGQSAHDHSGVSDTRVPLADGLSLER
ncbi:AAA family ATPase [Microbacterium sp. LTA6]|uniref:AAA family ATPase n=1 Tax=unclassified Microbacterium TaxID=2609290 RepID=UPI0032569251